MAIPVQPPTPLGPDTKAPISQRQPLALGAAVDKLVLAIALVLSITKVWDPEPQELAAWMGLYLALGAVISAVTWSKVWPEDSVRKLLDQEQAKTDRAASELAAARGALEGLALMAKPVGQRIAPPAPPPPPAAAGFPVNVLTAPASRPAPRP